MKRFLPVILLMMAVAAHAQRSESGQVFFDAISFAGDAPDSTRLDLYLAVPNSAITFDREGNTFTGRYQVTLKVAADGKNWLDTVFTRRVTAPAGAGGARPGLEFYQLPVIVPPGTYVASVELMDLRSNVTISNKRNVTTIDYSRFPFALSGLMLVSKIREDSSGYVITPMISEDVSRSADGYFLFFEAYNTTGKTATTFRATYKTPDGKKVMTTTFDKAIPDGKSQQWVRMSYTGLGRGTYVVELRATPSDDSTRTLAVAERMVRVEGSVDHLPLSEDELNEKISQIRYVATQSEMDFIKDGGTFAERQKRYADFWQKLDPTPGTPQNEAMDDYFQRIQYANDRYKSYAPGWLTDKGRVYIIYGPPDNVTSDPFRNDGKAIETWQYYDRSLRLVFVDESGFGDFRLVSPVSPGEKYHYGS
jgi:GWxTD domain-containing protein